MTRALATLSISFALGCGGATAAPDVVDDPEMAVETISGMRLVTVPRSTPELVHLSLFIDAGSRDASPPQVATLAAWSAGSDLAPRVLPDGTVFEVACTTEELPRCAGALAAALGARSGTDEEALRERLAATRRRALTDDARSADLLALRALFGEVTASSFSPLGTADEDDEASTGRIESFLADHYGPLRATLVAAGDVSGDDLREAVTEAFAGVAPARATRATRDLDAEGGARTAVVIGEQTTISAALFTSAGSSAVAIARAIERERATRYADGARLSVHGFGVRGGGLVIVRLAGVRPAEAGRRLVSILGRAALEATEPETIALPSEPSDAARLLGSAWLAGSGTNAEAEAAIGLGAIVAGGRADRMRSDDPDQPVQARAESHLGRATEEAWARLSPELSGDITAERGSVSLALNGARIDVSRRPADTDVAVALRFLGGGTNDPPALHGRAALIAALTATGCGARSAEALREHLSTLRATIAPLVDAETHGVVLRGPREHAFALVELGMACGLSPSVERADLVEARLSAIDRVDPIEAAAAAALTPTSPGLVAPRGTVGTLQSVSLPAVVREIAASRVGARTSVAIVGAVDVEEMVQRVARRLSWLDRGSPPPPPAAAPASDPDEIVPFETQSEGPRVVISFIARGASRPGPAAAAALAARIADSLSTTSGIRPVAVRAGTGADTTWLAVAVDVSEVHLDTLPERVAWATEAAREESFEADLSRRERQRRWTAAEPAIAAAALGRERLLGAPSEEADFSALEPPAFAIGRPR